MNKYTLEGVYPDGRVSGVIAESPRIKTVRGFLRANRGLDVKLIKKGFAGLFVRWLQDGYEVEETLDSMRLAWVPGPACEL